MLKLPHCTENYSGDLHMAEDRDRTEKTGRGVCNNGIKENTVKASELHWYTIKSPNLRFHYTNTLGVAEKNNNLNKHSHPWA